MYSSVDLYTLMYKCEIANGRVPCHLEILAGFDRDSIFARGMRNDTSMKPPPFSSLDATHCAIPLLLSKANHTSNTCRVRPIVCYGCYPLL
jgi:hypothetical protein